MAQDFLSYWRPDTLDAVIESGGPLNHAASNQYGRVNNGDTVWLVTVRSGRLRLAGRIIVSQVTDQAGATRILGETDLWEADYHILSVSGTEHQVTDLDIQQLAPQLRFDSAAGNDRLNVADDGVVSPQQLQTMRVLSPTSVGLLEEVLKQRV